MLNAKLLQLSGLLKRHKKTDGTEREGKASGSFSFSPSAAPAEHAFDSLKRETGARISRILRRASNREEALVGVDITPECVRICQMTEDNGQWRIDHLDAAVVDGTSPEDIWNHPDRYTEALTTLLQKNNISARHAALPLPVSSAIIKTLSLPLMSDEEITQALAVGSLWENFVQFPGELSDYAIFHEIIKRDAEANTMDMLFVAARKADVEHYAGIVEKAGLTPAIVDVRCFALNNAFGINGSGVALSQVVFLKFGPDENYVHIIDGGEPFLYDIYLSDQERASITTLVHNEEFLKRYARQAKQIIAAHEMKHRNGHVTHMYVVSLLPEIAGFIEKLALQLPEYTVSECDFFDHLNIPTAIAEYVDKEANRSAWAVALGLAVRRLDILGYLREITGADHVNLLAGAERFRAALRVDLYAKMGLIAASILTFCFFVGSFGALQAKTSTLEAQLAALHSVEPAYTLKLSKMNELNGLVKKFHSLDSMQNQLPSNQKRVLDAYRQIGAMIPYGVWLTEVKFTAPDRLDITGNSVSDQNILQFIRSLNGGDMFAKVSLKTMISATEKDATEMEQSLKVFTLQLRMNDEEQGV